MPHIVLRRAVDVVLIVGGLSVLLPLMSLAEARDVAESERRHAGAAPTSSTSTVPASASGDVDAMETVGYVAIVGVALTAALYVFAARRLDAKAAA